MVKKIFILLILFVVQFSVAQQKKIGDRYFEKADYIAAAKYYEEELQGRNHKKVVLRIATCYYNIFDYDKASMYLKKVVQGRYVEPDKSYDNKFNFMYYQVLSAKGDYQAAFEYLKIYNDNIERISNRKEYIETINQFKNKNPDYEIKSVDFNSPNSDFGAVKFKDSIYFTSDRETNAFLEKEYKWTHRPFLDIYALNSNKEVDSVGVVNPISGKVNSKLHEGNFCFSKDGNTLYISRSNFTNGKKEFHKKINNLIHLYVSKKVNGEWTEPVKLPFNQNSYSYQHPALSPKGDKLYFSSNEDGGEGSYDIYYVTVSGNEYGELVNLGPTINTPNREHFPYVSAKGDLYFSSNGHLGLGMLDIYASELVKGEWSKPVNLGAPINSSYDDFSLTYYNKTDGFFTSNRKEVNDDIYSFKQIGEIFLREVDVAFEVRDKQTDSIIVNSKIKLFDKKDQLVFSESIVAYRGILKKLFPEVYIYKASADGYISNHKLIRVSEGKPKNYIIYLEKEVVEIPEPEVVVETAVKTETNSKKTESVVKPVKKPEVVVSLPKNDKVKQKMLADTEGPKVVERDGRLFFELKPIYFDYDKWNIRADSKKILDELALKLDKYSSVYIKINSHTDNRGSVFYNELLSSRRAKSTRNYLALEGYVNARRMKYVGYGEKMLKVVCEEEMCTEEEHQLNRRSEFEIISY